MKIVSVVLALLITSNMAWSQCENRDGNLISQVKSSIENAVDNNSSMEDFLSSLPIGLRGNFIFMGESKSFQDATAKNPRVILSSPGSDVRLSFTVDPEARGGKEVELAIWDRNKGRYRYQELKFKNSGVEFDKNPASCRQCHGRPERPNWDNYNFWAGAIPHNKDTLVRGTSETRQYLDLLRRVDPSHSNHSPRLGALALDYNGDKGDKNPDRLESILNEKNRFMLPPVKNDGGITERSDGGIMVQTFDNLVERNACTATKLMQKRNSFDQVKYIAQGLKQGCNNLDDFMPENYDQIAGTYYRNVRGYGDNWPSNLPKGPLRDVIADTDRRQKGIVKDKIGRHISYLRKQPGMNTQQAIQEMRAVRSVIGLNVVGIDANKGQQPNPGFSGNVSELSSIVTIAENPVGVGRLRYYLEPLGVDVDRFSTSIDSTSYSFSDLFGRFLSGFMNGTGMNGKSCDELASSSRAALAPAVEDMKERAIKKCGENGNASSIAQTAATVNLYALREAARDVLNQESCYMCHTMGSSNGENSDGTPFIPFPTDGQMDMVILSCEVRKNNGTPANLGSKIWDRINRHSEAPGFMPQDGDSLSQSQKTTLKRWIDAELSKPACQ